MQGPGRRGESTPAPPEAKRAPGQPGRRLGRLGGVGQQGSVLSGVQARGGAGGGGVRGIDEGCDAVQVGWRGGGPGVSVIYGGVWVYRLGLCIGMYVLGFDVM
jgi:hypothetical protein